MRLAILASGSGGNAIVVEANGTCVLIDCGLGPRQLADRLRAVEGDPGSIEAVLVTHEHVDHVRGLAAFARRRRVPVFATAGTASALPETVREIRTLRAAHEVPLGVLTVLPVSTSHDAVEPVAFVISHRETRVGIVTDTGMLGPAHLEALAGCHALLVEANHDTDMLRLGRYPWPLKQRITSDLGHLSNEQARAGLEALAHDALEVVVAMHLSRENNTPELALGELGRVFGGSRVRIAAAHQDHPLVVEVGGPPRSRGQLALFDPAIP